MQIIYEAKQLRLCLRLLWVAVHAPQGLSCPTNMCTVHEQGTCEAESVGQEHCHGMNEADASSMSWARFIIRGWRVWARLDLLWVLRPCARAVGRNHHSATEKRCGLPRVRISIEFALHTRPRRCDIPRRRHGSQNTFTLTDTNDHVNSDFVSTCRTILRYAAGRRPRTILAAN